MNATGRLAEFAVKTTLDDCPAAAITLVRRAVLDSIGVMLAGAPEPAAVIARRALRHESGTPLCTVVGTAARMSPAAAALANGIAGHAHDFDDTNFILMGHPSVPLLSAALACAESETSDGARLVVGYLVGFEVSAAIGAAVNPAHYERGWHATSSVGTLGCAAAAVKILGLDVEQATHALGLAASLASGLKENFGSMTKPYHAGHAARNGVWAALLAREGFTASRAALDGAQGWVAAFAPGAALDGALESLGRRFHLLESGIAVKPYPSCALTHAPIDALLELRERHHLEPADIARVEVGVNRVTPNVLIHATPATALERKFSMQFCSAAALVDGRVDLASFANGPPEGRVRDMMSRVTMTVDPTLPERGEQHAWARVSVTLADGRTLGLGPRGAHGHPDQPLSDDQLRAKFFGCAAGLLGRDEAEAIAAQLAHVEDIPDVRALTARLVTDLE